MLSLNKNLFLLFLFISISFFAKSQSLLFPVKQNHKWGYMNIRGKLIIEPRYDIIGTQDLYYYSYGDDKIYSKYRLVETKEKLGLIDNRKAEVLAPKYNRIRILSDTVFAVIYNEGEDKFTAIDSAENIYFPEKYRDIKYLGKNKINGHDYFFVKDEGQLWGVQKSGDSLVLPPKYEYVEVCHVKGDFFKVKKEEKKGEMLIDLWGLVQAGDKKVLDTKYHKVKECHDNLFAATLGGKKLWAAYDSTGKQVLKEEYNYFHPLNRHLMAMQKHDKGTKRNQTFLYSFTREKNVPDRSQYAYLPLDEKFVIYIQDRKKGLLDTAGVVVMEHEYRGIRKYDNEHYKVNKNRKWGLWHPEKKVVLSCLYDSIGLFSNQLARVYSGYSVGLINNNFKEIIPPNYNKLKIEGKSIKAFKGKEVIVYKLDDNNEVIGNEDFKNVFSFKLKGKGGEVIDAKEVKRKLKVINRTIMAQPNPENYTYAYKNSVWRWFVKSDSKKGLEVFLSDSTVIKKSKHPNLKKISSLNLKFIHNIGETGTSFLYSRKHKYKSSLSIMTGLSILCKASIFHHQKEDLITPFSILGVRKYDYYEGYKNAAVLDENEEFGLMDKDGNYVKGKDGKKLAFTYIGPFYNGIARACQGGKLIEMENTDFLKYSIEDIEIFCEHFNLVGYYSNDPKKGRIRIASPEKNPAKWGFIDNEGNFIISPQYKYLEDDIDGQAVAVNQEGKWGVIETKTNRKVIDFKYAKISDYYGEWRINARAGGEIYFNKRGWQIVGSEYDSKGDFYNGFCKVQKDGKWGFIEESGDLAIPCKYDVVKNFKDNIAAAKSGNTWAFIDKSGEEFLKIKAPNVADVGNIVNGRFWFKSGEQYGFIDTTGQIIVPAKYSKVFNYENDVARVIQNKKTGIIDLEGNEIIKPTTFTFIYPFNQYGLAIIQKDQRGNQGLINSKGKIILSPTYHFIDKFSDGLAIVDEGKDFGYIDTLGKLVIPMKFKEAKPFSEGLAPVRKSTQDIWVFINKKGKQAFKKSFLSTTPFIDGQAFVNKYTYGKREGEGMIIDKKGKPIFEDLNALAFYEDNITGVFNGGSNPNKKYYYGDIRLNNLFDAYFQEVNPFTNGFSVFRRNRKLGVINKRGMMVVKNKYYSLEVMGKNIITVKPPAFGIADRTGKITIPIQFDQITLMSGDIYKVEQGEKIGYTDKTGKWIWELQY